MVALSNYFMHCTAEIVLIAYIKSFVAFKIVHLQTDSLSDAIVTTAVSGGG
jgi:hypothetical protein